MFTNTPSELKKIKKEKPVKKRKPKKKNKKKQGAERKVDSLCMRSVFLCVFFFVEPRMIRLNAIIATVFC